MASSVSGQDEPNPALWRIGYPSNKKVFEAIFNAHLSEHCSQSRSLRNYTSLILFHRILYGFKTHLFHSIILLPGML